MTLNVAERQHHQWERGQETHRGVVTSHDHHVSCTKSPVGGDAWHLPCTSQRVDIVKKFSSARLTAMDHPTDDTTEIVTRYISDLLERRADAVHSSTPHTPAVQREAGRRLAQEEFREEMVSRFEKLKHLAKETATRSAKVRNREHRAHLRSMSLVVAGIAAALVYSLLWIKSETGPNKSAPLPDTAKQPAERRVPPLGAPAEEVTHDEPSSAVPTPANLLTAPPAAHAPSAQHRVHFRPTGADGFRRALRPAGFAFVASLAHEVAMEQRAKQRIVALLTKAVNDKILGSSVAASVARIELQPSPIRASVVYHYSGDVVDDGGQVVGRVSGTYSIDPESLSATVLYHGDDRVEYSESYFQGKL